MGLFGFFKKKKKDQTPSQATEPVATPVAEEKPAPQPEPVAEPAPVVEAAPAPEGKAEEPAAAPVAEEKAAAPKASKATAAKKTSSTSAKKNASSGTTAPKKAPASKKPATHTSAAPKKKNAAPVSAGRPFFITTDEDVKVAFETAIAEAEAEIAASGSRAVGKYEFNLEVDGYHFYLLANNGQVLFDSPSFTTLIGALNGIKTFKKAVSTGSYVVKSDKYKRYRFIFSNKYYGENYTTKDQCAKCAESVQKFANNARIIPYQPDQEAVMEYETAKSMKNKPENVDWNAVAEAERIAERKGKFEICREESGEYCFYLLANNAQILYSSRYFSGEAACRKGIESFKRAAYVGNFFVDRDKFGNFRYVLKNIGSAPSFIGESYDNKPQCEKIIESVKNFIVTASIEIAEESAE